MAGTNGTFGGRFDDPDAQYRVLYACTQRFGCFLETLAKFRADIELLAELAAIDGENDFPYPGTVPLEWIEARSIGSAEIQGSYADVGANDWLGHLRVKLAREMAGEGFKDFDASVSQQAEPRRLTQAISRVVNGERLNGIRYLSRYGHDIENWAIFEPFEIEVLEKGPLLVNDPDLNSALVIHGLLIGAATH